MSDKEKMSKALDLIAEVATSRKGETGPEGAEDKLLSFGAEADYSFCKVEINVEYCEENNN